MRRVPVLTIVGLVAALALVPVVQAEVGNAPDANDNNRVASVAAGNIFFNGVVPGDSIASVANLEGLVGGSGSPDGATGAALIATVAEADGAMVEGVGVDPMIEADGSYSVATSADFSGAYIVSFGDASGNGASLVVASAIAADVADMTLIPVAAYAQAGVDVADGVVTVTAGADEAVLAIAGMTAPIAAEGVVTISVDYESDVADLSLAVIGFDGAVAGTTPGYSNPIGGLAVGTVKTLAISMLASSGAIVPAVQVYNPTGAAATISFSNLQVIAGGAVTDYAAGAANATLPAFAEWGGNLTQAADQGMPEATADGIALNASAVAAVNAFTLLNVTAGELTAEAVFTAANNEAGDFFVVMFTDGAANTIASYAQAETGAVVAAGTISADTTGYLVVQAAGFDAAVSEVVLTQVADGTAFDPALIGM